MIVCHISLISMLAISCTWRKQLFDLYSLNETVGAPEIITNFN
jgi:hypothetical protein